MERRFNGSRDELEEFKILLDRIDALGVKLPKTTLEEVDLLKGAIYDTFHASANALQPGQKTYAEAVKLSGPQQFCWNCEKGLQEKEHYYVHPLWKEDKICNACATKQPRCIVCERPTETTVNLIIGQSSGRETFFLCSSCDATGRIRNEEELMGCVNDAVEFFAKSPELAIDLSKLFVFRTTVDLTEIATSAQTVILLRLASVHELSQPIENLPVMTTPLGMRNTWRENLVFGKFQLRSFQVVDSAGEPQIAQAYEITVCRGLQKDILTSVLVHEIFHGVLHQEKMSFEVEEEESICNALSVLFLQRTEKALELAIPKEKGQNLQLANLRKDICNFRGRRLQLGDYSMTKSVAWHLHAMADKNWLEQLKLQQRPIAAPLTPASASPATVAASSLEPVPSTESTEPVPEDTKK